MLYLTIFAAVLSFSLTLFCIFYHFWAKRQFKALEEELRRLRDAGINVDMDRLMAKARESKS